MVRRVQLFIAGIGLSISACSGGSPTSPAPTPSPTPAPAPQPTTVTVTGHVMSTNVGQPLGGVSASLAGTTTITDISGVFRSTFLPMSSLRLALVGASIVPRSLLLETTSTRDVTVDAIALGGDFDLSFYRSLVRNTFDAPSGSEPLRRWTRTPSFYLKTVDEAGEAIHGPTLNLIESVAKEAVPIWTSGTLGTPIIERGTGTREGQPGWITIKFPAGLATTYCGRATVGQEGGWIELSYHVPPTAPIICRVPGAVIAPTVIRHEVGHSLGFFHTGGANDLMKGGNWSNLDQQPSLRELVHAAIAYRRPVGNVEPDSDPAGTLNLAPMTVR
jgi:hypothetical protein